MLKKYIECGRIVSTHGIKGELKIQPWIDDVQSLLQFTLLHFSDPSKFLEVESSRIHKGMLLVKVKGTNSINDANLLRGKVVYIDREDGEDSDVFPQDYIGLSVVNVDHGTSYGNIVEVMKTGANDVFVLKDTAGMERLVPDIPHVVLEVDFLEGLMKIRPLKGLFDNEN